MLELRDKIRREEVEQEFLKHNLSKENFEIFLLESISSTMDFLKVENEHRKKLTPIRISSCNQKKPITTVLSLQQTAGRGREGRQWLSNRQAGVYANITLEVPDKANLTGYSLIVALSIITSLDKLGFNELGLKWPNDIYHNKEMKKLAGILVDRINNKINLGFGLNLYDNPALSNLNATCLENVSEKAPRLPEIFASCSCRIIKETRNFLKKGFTDYLDQCNSFNILTDRTVKFDDNGILKEAKVLKIAKDGALLLLVNGKEMKIYNNRVHLN